jgi:hypothetical protein
VFVEGTITPIRLRSVIAHRPSSTSTLTVF